MLQKNHAVRANAYYLNHPKSLEIGEVMPSSLHRRLDDGLYLIHTILRRLTHSADKAAASKGGYVRLKSDILARTMDHRTQRKVIDALLENDVIQRISYQVGSHCFGYRLCDRFMGSKHVRTMVRDPRLIRAIDRNRQRFASIRTENWLPIHFALDEHQRRLRIDMEHAEEIIRSLPIESNPFDIQRIIARNIHEQRFHFRVGKYGRVSNSISSMKREVRASLRHNGNPLTTEDISNSQPAFLALTAHTINAQQQTSTPTNQQHPHPPPTTIHDFRFSPDLVDYCYLAGGGLLYDELQLLLRAKGHDISRDDLKRRVLTDIFAKKRLPSGSEYPSLVEDVFAERFPSVYLFIRQFNCNGIEHKNLIRYLQTCESNLVIHRVAADLIERGIPLVLTLHDAIFTSHDSGDMVVAGFEKAFDAQEFKMKITRKSADK